MQQFIRVAANVNRSWSKLFEDALDVSLFYDSGIVLNENTLIEGEKLINSSSLSFDNSMIGSIDSDELPGVLGYKI